MTTLVKLHGLPRGKAAGSSDLSPISTRGLRVKIANVPPAGGAGAVVATRLAGVTTAGRVRVNAKAAGQWGNNLTFATVNGASLGTAGVITTSGAAVTYTFTIVDATTTDVQLRAALNADPQFLALFAPTSASDSGSAAGTMTHDTGALSTGADGTSTPLQPLLAVISDNTTVVVDVDDLYNARILRRDKGVNYISLGAA
jgi:hypothetical protein